MKQYIDCLKTVLDKGRWVEHERTGKRILSTFGGQMEFDLSEGIPLLTTRKVPWKNAIKELLWFLSGSTNMKDLKEAGPPLWGLWSVRIQDMFSWQSKTNARGGKIAVGECGPIYGAMWRHWPKWDGGTIDQIQYVIDTLKSNPSSRRMVVTGWNPDVLPDESVSPQENIREGRQCLPPCHTLFQFNTEPLTLHERLLAYVDKTTSGEIAPVGYIEEKRADILRTIEEALPPLWKLLFLSAIGRPCPAYSDFEFWLSPETCQHTHKLLDIYDIPKYRLNCKLYARSQDLPLGTVFNVFSYSVLTCMVAKQVNMLPGRYIHTMGDMHIYEDQWEQVRELVSRSPRTLPKLRIREGVASLFDYTIDDFEIVDYNPHPAIKFPLTK